MAKKTIEENNEKVINMPSEIAILLKENGFDCGNGLKQRRVIDKMRDEVPALENSGLSEADVRHVIELFQESSEYFNKKIKDERDADGGSRLAIDLFDGVIDARELAVQYVLHRLNIKSRMPHTTQPGRKRSGLRTE
jgi:hypothetical protein